MRFPIPCRPSRVAQRRWAEKPFGTVFTAVKERQGERAVGTLSFAPVEPAADGRSVRGTLAFFPGKNASLVGGGTSARRGPEVVHHVLEFPVLFRAAEGMCPFLMASKAYRVSFSTSSWMMREAP